MIPLTDNLRAATFPLGAVALCGICILVFFWQLLLGDQEAAFVLRYGLVPAAVFDDTTRTAAVVGTFVSYIFLHGGWLHLSGNILYMWVFAGKIEDAMGHIVFVVFFIVCGVLAAIAQAAPEPLSSVPVIGASGAVSGILGAYLLLHPRSEITIALPVVIMVDVVRLPAWVVLSAWFVLQLLLDSPWISGSGGIALRAHIGGFVAGILLTPLCAPAVVREHFRRQSRRPD